MSEFQSELSSLIPDYCNILEELDMSEYEDYQFSEKYLRRKRKLIKNEKKVYYPLIKTTSRRVASIILAAAFAGATTVCAYEPTRTAVKDFIVNLFSGYSVIVHQNSASSESLKEEIDYFYSIDVPNEFELNVDESVSTNAFINQYYYSPNKDNYIFFSQYTKDTYKSYVDNEHSQTIQKTDKNDNLYLCSKPKENQTLIIWDNDEYIFELESNLNEKDIMDLYYSLH